MASPNGVQEAREETDYKKFSDKTLSSKCSAHEKQNEVS